MKPLAVGCLTAGVLAFTVGCFPTPADRIKNGGTAPASGYYRYATTARSWATYRAAPQTIPVRAPVTARATAR